MRIAYVHYIRDAHAARGGPGVHISSSTSALRALGHTVDVIGAPINAATAPVLATRRRRALRRAIASYVFEPRALLSGVWQARRDLPRIRAAHPDVIVARYEAFEYGPILIARALGVPLVWEVNGTTTEITRFNSELVLYPGTAALERWALNAAAAVFVVSDELKSQVVQQGVYDERVAVIPNGADPERFTPELRSSAAAGDLPADAVVIGYLGSFSSWHDIRTMLTVILELAAADPTLRFVLAGARVTDLEPALQRSLADLGGRVVLPGVVPIADAARWMARFDVALSLYPPDDSFYFSPVKLFEYMASGTAIVATDIGQQGRIIRHRVNGMLTRPGDAADVRQAIETLVRDAPLRRQLGRAARTTLVENYTWGHNARRISDLCENVVSGGEVAKRNRWASPSRVAP